MTKWEQFIKKIASILFIIIQVNGFFFTYALLLDAINIDLSNGAMYITAAAAMLSTWGMFSYLVKRGD